MPSQPLREDLPSSAPLQFAHARTHCGYCAPYHALWPYLRLARQVGGVEADEPHLAPLLTDLLRRRPMSVLVAGSADSGVASLVQRAVQASGRQDHRLTIVDRCPTPLATCDRLAQAGRLGWQTRVADLRELPPTAEFDLALGHSVLQFFTTEQRQQALNALRGALAPDGRLVLVARLAAASRDREQHAREPAQWASSLSQAITASLRDQAVDLPCSRADLDQLVEDYVRANGYHVAPHECEEALRADLERSGFDIEQLATVGKGSEFMPGGRSDVRGRQGLVAVATPRTRS